MFIRKMFFFLQSFISIKYNNFHSWQWKNTLFLSNVFLFSLTNWYIFSAGLLYFLQCISLYFCSFCDFVRVILCAKIVNELFLLLWRQKLQLCCWKFSIVGTQNFLLHVKSCYSRTFLSILCVILGKIKKDEWFLDCSLVDVTKLWCLSHVSGVTMMYYVLLYQF